MTSPEQHKEILLSLGEIQSTLDILAHDSQVMREHVLQRPVLGEEDPQPPPWVNQGDELSEIDEAVVRRAEEIRGTSYPPPARSNMGSAVGVVVIHQAPDQGRGGPGLRGHPRRGRALPPPPAGKRRSADLCLGQPIRWQLTQGDPGSAPAGRVRRIVETGGLHPRSVGMTSGADETLQRKE